MVKIRVSIKKQLDYEQNLFSRIEAQTDGLRDSFGGGHQDNINQSHGRTKTIDSNIIKSSQSRVFFFQIQLIKCLEQNNEISTSSL